jgi:hypothetical protein
MSRLVLIPGLFAASLLLCQTASAQYLPLGAVMDAIGQAQSATPPSGAPPADMAPPQGRKRRAEPVRQEPPGRGGNRVIEYHDRRGLQRGRRDDQNG